MGKVQPLVGVGYDFAGDMAARGFVNKDQLQAVLTAYAAKINECAAALALVQRDDGALIDNAVRFFHLSAEVRGLFGNWYPKMPVLYGTTANITLSGLGTQAGGEWLASLPAGTRILVLAQTNAAQNGVYIAAAGAWTRASDLSTAGTLSMAYVLVAEGATLKGLRYVCAFAASEITVGTTLLPWTLIGGSPAGSAGFTMDFSQLGNAYLAALTYF